MFFLLHQRSRYSTIKNIQVVFLNSHKRHTEMPRAMSWKFFAPSKHVLCQLMSSLSKYRISSLALSGLCDQVDGGESCCPTSEDCPNLKGNPGELQLFLLSEFSGLNLLSSAFICPYGLHCCPKTRRTRSMCCCCCCCCCRCRRNWRLSVVWGLLVLVGVAVAFLMVVLVFIALRWILVLVLSSAAHWNLVPGRQAQALVLQSAIQGASEGCDGRADSRSWMFSLRPALLICLR
jgi:hypothetical protein